MSRNRTETYCEFCSADLKLEEEPRPITREEAGVYFGEYEGMLVAKAACPECEAKYLAWCKPRPDRASSLRLFGEDLLRGFYDTSFRSTFDDEPGEEDLPKYEVRRRVVYERVGPFKG